jgi:hypothetical protein
MQELHNNIVRNIEMNRIIAITFAFTIISGIALAELPEETMKSHVDMMENEFKLAPIMKQIQNGKIDSIQISILYTILQNTTEVRIHQQNGAKDNQIYISPDGHKEAVYDKNGKLVKDGINDGSYNESCGDNPEQTLLRLNHESMRTWEI